MVLCVGFMCLVLLVARLIPERRAGDGDADA
jgi:hypothetical protein